MIKNLSKYVDFLLLYIFFLFLLVFVINVIFVIIKESYMYVCIFIDLLIKLYIFFFY